MTDFAVFTGGRKSHTLIKFLPHPSFTFVHLKFKWTSHKMRLASHFKGRLAKMRLASQIKGRLA